MKRATAPVLRLTPSFTRRWARGLGLDGPQDSLPRAVRRPPSMTVVNRLPATGAGGQVPAGEADRRRNRTPSITRRWHCRRRLPPPPIRRQVRLEPSSLFIREISPPHVSRNAFSAVASHGPSDNPSSSRPTPNCDWAQPLAADRCRPWERTVSSARLTPARVSRDFRHSRPELVCLAEAPKPPSPDPVDAPTEEDPAHRTPRVAARPETRRLPSTVKPHAYRAGSIATEPGPVSWAGAAVAVAGRLHSFMRKVMNQWVSK